MWATRSTNSATGRQHDLNRQDPSFDEYLAGGFLANSLVLFFVYGAKHLPPEYIASAWLELLSSLIVVAGGGGAGYLVARKTQRNFLLVGLKTGVSAFLVNFAFSSIVFEGTSMQYGLWILLLFCSGSSLGAQLRKRRRMCASD